MKKKNLWILTEERPKGDVIGTIIEKFAKDYKIACFINNIKILPMIDENQLFSFSYEVKGLDSHVVDKVYIKIVSGYKQYLRNIIWLNSPNKLSSTHINIFPAINIKVNPCHRSFGKPMISIPG